jgi:hypothetical protein
MKKTVLKVLTAMLILANAIVIPAQALSINDAVQPVAITVNGTDDPRAWKITDPVIIPLGTDDPRGW